MDSHKKEKKKKRAYALIHAILFPDLSAPFLYYSNN